MKPKYDIAVEISENELRHLIQLHAGRISGTLFANERECQHYMQNAAERMSALLDILKAKKHAR
jgi:hypothetical protein